MSDIKELATEPIYWPSRKWYGEWIGEQLFAASAKAAIVGGRALGEHFGYHGVISVEPKLYIWPETSRVPSKKVSYLKLQERLGELQKRRAADLRRLTAPIEDSIEVSKTILQIDENWDGEGSRKYAESTWKRAIRFVQDSAIPFIIRHRKQIQPPKISAGPDASIDVRWTSEKRTLLINFPEDENTPPDFFGHDKGQDVIKGTLDLASQNHWLLLWLTR